LNINSPHISDTANTQIPFLTRKVSTFFISFVLGLNIPNEEDKSVGEEKIDYY
jgi:hypothetical protein